MGDTEAPDDPAVSGDHALGGHPVGAHGDGAPGVSFRDDASPAGFVGCDETIERLYFYLDGELTDQRREEISRHLDLCGPCVGAYGFEAELRKVIASRCKDHVPDHLVARVADAIRDEHSRQSN